MIRTSLRNFKCFSHHLARIGAVVLSLAIVFALAIIATPGEAQSFHGLRR